MSMPNIPDIRPEINIDREKAVDLIIASVALEELALAHIINAEAEKIQSVLGTLDTAHRTEPPTIDEILKINNIVERILKKVIAKEIILEFKLQDAIDLISLESEEHGDGDDDDE